MVGKMNAKNGLKDILRDLNGAMGVSGHEHEVIKVVYSGIKGYADAVNVSRTGNVVAIKKGKKPGPSLLIGAHLDEVGYIVRNILADGFLTVDKIGFPTDSCAVGRKVWVSDERIPGLFGIRPGHLLTPEESARVVPANQNYVDVGCASAEEVRALGIKIGDQIVLQSDFMEMANPDLICTRAIDNRIGCAVIMHLFQTLSAEDFGGTLYGVFSTREEPGLHGAVNAIYDYDIDYAIALDTVPCADTPDSRPERELPLFLGKGPAFVVCEASHMRYQFSHPSVRKIIEESAERAGIGIQTVSLAFAGYLTDASSYAYAGGGIPTSTLAIPRRYSHSPVELVNLNDAAATLALLRAIVVANEDADLRFVDLP